MAVLAARRRRHVPALVAAALVLLLTSACGGGGETANTGAEAVQTTPSEPSPAEEPVPVQEPVPAEEPPAGKEETAPVDPPEDEADAPSGEADEAEEFTTPTGVTCTNLEPDMESDRPTFTEPPAFELEDGVTYSATLETSCGTIVLELDAEAAPITTNNFVVLSRSGFYDGITFHRAVPGFVIQGGDPLGTGFGGPGYEFEDELPTDGYALGDLAMANAGPDTNGSQFFIVTGDASALPNDFSKFGAVVEGLEVAQAIESLGDPATQMPVAPVYIYSVEITES